MSDNDINLELLRRIPLLSRLDDTELSRLSSLMKHQVFGANEPVIWIGEAGDELYLIVSGQVTVTYPDESGKEVILATLTDGDFFGDVAILDGGPRTASVRTITACDMLVLRRDEFLGFLRLNPDAAIDILTTVGRRHRETLDKLRGVTNANTVIEQKMTHAERVADAVARVSASQPFVIFHVFWFSAWMAANLLATTDPDGRFHGWDPYPFGLLSLIISVEAIFLSIFLLISANRAGEKDRIRADADYQVNLKAQYEIMQLHAKLDRLTALLSDKPR
ncbi:MAG: DUF1003 domain-containing protein [Burkholderiales bacterium]|nr:DUF1003 domain-containing protein [Phycisphaerae bacterium]